MKPLVSTFKRKPKKRDISRSFRIPPDVDRALAEEAARRRWTKTFLIRDILCGWLSFQQAKQIGELPNDQP
jgi:hypothetical protein